MRIEHTQIEIGEGDELLHLRCAEKEQDPEAKSRNFSRIVLIWTTEKEADREGRSGVVLKVHRPPLSRTAGRPAARPHVGVAHLRRQQDPAPVLTNEGELVRSLHMDPSAQLRSSLANHLLAWRQR